MYMDAPQLNRAGLPRAAAEALSIIELCLIEMDNQIDNFHAAVALFDHAGVVTRNHVRVGGTNAVRLTSTDTDLSRFMIPPEVDCDVDYVIPHDCRLTS